MKAFKHNEIFGNWATLLLTTDKKGWIDYSKLSDEIDILIASKPNGLYSNGTAGEFYTLTEKEFDKTSMLFADKCNNSGTPFQIGVSHPCPQISLQRLERIKSLQPCAVQLILPDWYPVNLKEAICFLQKMEIEARGISLVLYNPPHAKKQLSPEEWTILKKHIPSLMGVKVFDQNGDPKWYSKMRKNSERLSVFIPGHHLATGIQSGAQGTYSNMACLNPFTAQKWYNLIMKDMKAGLELEERIKIFRQEFVQPLKTIHHFSSPAIDRFFALLGAWTDIGEKMRWPYKSVPYEYVHEIKPKVVKLLPEFFIT